MVPVGDNRISMLNSIAALLVKGVECPRCRAERIRRCVNFFMDVMVIELGGEHLNPEKVH